jgi:hypothetical protein
MSVVDFLRTHAGLSRRPLTDGTTETGTLSELRTLLMSEPELVRFHCLGSVCSTRAALRGVTDFGGFA